MTPSATVIGGGGPWSNLLVFQNDLVMLVATFGGMLMLLMLEARWPRRLPAELSIERWLNNWLLATLNFVVVLWIIRLVGRLPGVAGLGQGHGLLATVHPALAFVGVLLVFEATVYAAHRLFHAIPLLWRFHAVHHLDAEVDVTTSHRHHTVEVLLVSLVFVLIVAVLGAPPVVIALVALLRVAGLLFSHSNLALPARVDHILRWMIVTPDFHRLHHSADPLHTNSNFGAILPWFDYLFGSASRVPDDAQRDLSLGVATLRRDQSSRIDRLLLLPLQWSRWQDPSATGPRPPAGACTNR